MNYKVELQNNNIDLNNILAAINALPDASSGGNNLDTSDATAVASDIASGKTAYVDGVKITGTHVCSSGINTSDATANASDIASGKTAYVNGGKVTGTMVVQNYYVDITPPDDSFGNDGDLFLVRGE